MLSLRLLVLIAFSCSIVQAADQTVLGAAFLVKDPGTPTRRKAIVKAKEVDSDNTVVGNPLADGAIVTITLNGVTPSQETFFLPAGASRTSGKAYWSGEPARGFKYRDAYGENGPVKSATLKQANGTFQIHVSLSGRQDPLAIFPPNPGTDGCMLFVIPGGDSYSVQFVGGQVTNKEGALFKVAKPNAEGICLPRPTPTPTATASITSTPTQTPTATPGFPFISPPGPAPLRYRDLIFPAVNTTDDVTYGSAINASGETITLKLDIYEPLGDAVTERPAIVWVHGGSFCCGNKTSPEIVDQANTFARKGYFNVSINYRLEPGGCDSSVPTATCITAIREARDDAKTAIRFLRANAAGYGIDVSRIAIAGSSAGAITALNVGFSSSEDPTAAVGGAVSLSGAQLLSGGTMGFGDAPSLLFHGTGDSVVPYQWAVNTWNQATAAGLDSFLTAWTGAGHVPYTQHRTEILDQTTNFLYWELDLAAAAQ